MKDLGWDLELVYNEAALPRRGPGVHMFATTTLSILALVVLSPCYHVYHLGSILLLIV